MSSFRRKLTTSAVAAICSLVASTAGAQTVLKASHQFPGGKGDIRDEMVQLIAREVAAANVGLEIQVFPGRLFTSRTISGMRLHVACSI